jgi:hypothetical protein
MNSVKTGGATVLALSACLLLGGCSREAANQSLYESMRYISNEENAQNPNYDPDNIEDYNLYKARREGEIEKGE